VYIYFVLCVLFLYVIGFLPLCHYIFIYFVISLCLYLSLTLSSSFFLTYVLYFLLYLFVRSLCLSFVFIRYSVYMY